MKDFFQGLAGKLSERGVLGLVGIVVGGVVCAEGIACLTGYEFAISKSGLTCKKAYSSELPSAVIDLQQQKFPTKMERRIAQQ